MTELIDKGTINNKYSSVRDCVSRIRVNEGIKGLWKGNSIALARFFPNEIINNSVKNSAQKIMAPSMMSNIVAGVVGGWTSALILYPIDTVRILISTSNSRTS